jgi:hypothetical protein
MWGVWCWHALLIEGTVVSLRYAVSNNAAICGGKRNLDLDQGSRHDRALNTSLPISSIPRLHCTC